MNIIDEVISEGEEKLVIFSQWERMTRLVAQELDERGIGYEYLHGGVPGNKRGELYKGFTNDPEKRVFLSTDAGGVGLNLQAGSIVINLVAAGTIEHRMLSVLKFKSSMAAGILDGGEDAIFMGESRFKKFMQTVDDLVLHQTEGREEPGTAGENTTPSMEASMAKAHEETAEAGLLAEDAGLETVESDEQTKEPGVGGDGSDPQLLLKSGLDFLSGLSVALSRPETTKQLVDSIVSQDPADGKTYLKIPIESRQVVENIFGLIGSVMKGIGK